MIKKKTANLKMRNIRFDDKLWLELGKTAKYTKQNKSKFVRIAVMEKIRRIERNKER